jgi:hypothetical protein
MSIGDARRKSPGIDGTPIVDVIFTFNLDTIAG